MSNVDKNKQIKETYLATLAKREKQRVRVFTVKIQQNKLNKQQAEHLKMLFVEAKWMKNHVLNLSNNTEINIFDLKYTNLNEVIHLDKNKTPIISELKYLSSQMKQEVLTDIHINIRALSKAKAKGMKVGKLNYVSEYNSINLKQSGVSYKIVNKSKIKIQGIKKPFKVNGLEQLEKLGVPYELANAKLICKPSGYYIALTVYTDKNENIIKKPLIGIDMGCQTSFTLSDGTKLNCIVEESEQLKRTQRKLMRSKKGSSNRWKLRIKLRKLYERDNNVKNNLANQLCSYLNNYQVVMQDEQLKAWKRHHGKKIQHSILGRVKARFTLREDTIVLDRFVPTTKLCRDCGHLHDTIHLWDREFICPECGVVYDRDIHAAENMVWIYENIIGVERTKFKPVDFRESLLRYFEGGNRKHLIL